MKSSVDLNKYSYQNIPIFSIVENVSDGGLLLDSDDMIYDMIYFRDAFYSRKTDSKSAKNRSLE